MPRVVHFEIAANDPERMIAFYRDVFDWEISDWDQTPNQRLCCSQNAHA